MEDLKVIQLSSETGYPGSTGFLRYDPDKDRLILSIWYGEDQTVDPIHYDIPDFQTIAEGFEESILTRNCYLHPGTFLVITAEAVPGYRFYIDERIVTEVDRQKFLNLIRRYGLTRSVVTNVPRPEDPVLKTLQNGDIILRDSNLVFDIGGNGNPDDFRTYPINLVEFSLAYQQEWFPFELGSGLSIYRSEMPLHDQRFSLHLFGAENSIGISLGAMKSFVKQIDRMLVWERMYTDS